MAPTLITATGVPLAWTDVDWSRAHVSILSHDAPGAAAVYVERVLRFDGIGVEVYRTALAGILTAPDVLAMWNAFSSMRRHGIDVRMFMELWFADQLDLQRPWTDADMHAHIAGRLDDQVLLCTGEMDGVPTSMAFWLRQGGNDATK